MIEVSSKAKYGEAVSSILGKRLQKNQKNKPFSLGNPRGDMNKSRNLSVLQQSKFNGDPDSMMLWGEDL